MAKQEPSLSALAEEALKFFETRKRDNGREFFCLKDDAPEWLTDLCREAHRDPDGGTMLPDDWRYEFIQDSLDRLADYECPDSARDWIEEDSYTADLIRWLGSHHWRVSYCDTAADEYEVEIEADVIRRIGLGQLWEKRHVFDQVRSFLENRLEEEDAA